MYENAQMLERTYRIVYDFSWVKSRDACAWNLARSSSMRCDRDWINPVHCTTRSAWNQASLLYSSLFILLITCTTHTAHGQWFNLDVIKSYLNETSPAKIIEPPINVRVVAGETALFFCRATGNPTPTVNFLIDRTISHPRLGVGVVLTIPDGSLLRLTKAHREQNGLQVECVARNHVGGDSATAHLTVYEANSDIPEGYPVIHVAPKPTTAAVGDIARLDCDVVGTPTPRVIWIKNEIPIPTSGSRISIVGTGSLLFDHLLLSDEGHYECLVTNEVGSVLSSKAYLSVKNTYFVPKIVDKVDQVRVRPGHGANLTCRAAGNPIPSTRWLTDRERPITESKEGVATLFLADVTEPARYICEANNSLGTVQHPVRVNVLEVPPPPQNLRCLEEGPTYAFLQWHPPNIPRDTRVKVPEGQVIDSYTLFLTKANESTATGTTGPSTGAAYPFRKQLTDIPARQFHPDGALQYKVTDLKPYTNYSVEVAAVSNLLGMSDPSNRIVFTTAEVPPSSAPRLPNAVAVSDTTIRVAWQPPTEANGKILRYTVAYSRDQKLPISKWRRVETSSESTQIGGLQSSETYYIRVAGSNSVGSGPFSEAIPVIVKYGVPSQPMNFRGISLAPERIYLNWSLPEVPKSVRLQDFFLRYRGAAQPEAAHAKPTEYAIAPTLTSYVLENLNPNTTYHISLAARTTYGVGVAAQITVRTESNVPGMPVLHELDALDSSRIRVRWLAAPITSVDWSNVTDGEPRPSQVQQFLVQWAPFPFTDWDEKRVRAHASVPHAMASRQVYELVIGGLLSRTAYRIRIIAIGSKGFGAALELGPLNTKGQVPSAPRNLRLNQLRRALPPGVTDPSAEFAVLELAWDPPERSHGDLRGYQVSHRLIGPPELVYSQRTVTDTGPQKPVRRNVTQTAYTSTLADGIKFGRVYQFEVAAYNGVDLGLPAQLNVSTPEDVPDNFPVQVRLNGLSATAIEVTWSPPIHQQWPGEILSYQVRYFQPSSPNTTEVITNTAEPRLRIENLKERTFYTVMVRAITGSGPGPWSMASTIRTTAELPEPPSQITGVRINQRQIKVTWSTLPIGPKTPLPGQSQPHHPVPITGFRIYYAKNENPQDLSTWQILDVGPVTMATLDALDPGSEYVIKIKSRGADRRYGRLSDPVVVGIHVPDDGLSGGPSGFPSPAGRALNEKRAIRQLSCHWIPALDNARPGEASLKLNWQRPAQVDGLYQFQIQLLGSKSYTDENNQPHRVHFEPRTLEVSSAMLDSSLASPAPIDYSLGLLEPQPQYSLVIDELEANTVYDVQIRPVYNSPTLGHLNEAKSPMGRTSCRTLMLPPSTVPRPVPVAVKPQTGQVVMRVFRVSESLGRIRRYYLILSKTNAAQQDDTGSVVQEVYWQNKLRDASQLWNPDTFIAAEYSQEVFVEPQLEILLSTPNYNRFRRRAVTHPIANASRDQVMQADAPASPAPDVLVYGRQLIKDQDYKAFVLACIYANSEPITKYQKPGVPGLLAQTVSSKMDDDAPSANLCTASTWSVPFSPNRPITEVDLTAGSGTSESSTEPKARAHVNQAGSGTGGTGTDMFTVSLIAVIVGLGIIAIVCIAVGCVMRRRRPKQLRNDMSITLVNSDNTLKTPLMNPKLSTFSETNGKVDGSPTGYQTPESVPNVACVTNSIPPTPTKVRSAVTTAHLPEHVAMLKANGGLEMAEEYESLETGVGLTWKHANLEVNRPKNRYANVVAYDHSRVLLSPIGDVPGSDYINANYIDGYQRSKAYIATQGPLPETFYDFWRMIWEQNSYVIVMMTRLEERARVKCDQYWPTRGVDTYPSPYQSKINPGATYKVSLKDTAEFAYYTLRTFLLERHESDAGVELAANRMNSHSDLASTGHSGVETREIKQFQFTAWPDYGTPDHAQPLLLFIRRVTQVRAHILHQLQQERLANGDSVIAPRTAGVDLLRTNSPQPTSEIGPTIVHCSAGVGRTGAFIVIDSQLERLRHEKSVDIYGSVSRMRNQRNFMVQTEEQYTFLYDVFVEAATVNGTEVTAHGLYNHVVKLRQTAPTNLLAQGKPIGNGLQDPVTGSGNLPINAGQSGLELEFNRLNVNLYNKKQFTSAVLPENRLKNRSNELLPYESNRVCLPLVRGLSGSDYINASFVDGYRKKRAYIATQTPLPNTVDDFWRLVWEHNSPIIVMLNETVDHVTSMGVQQQPDFYWPMERSTRYQHLLVEPMVEYNMPHFILREFRLTDTRDGQSRTLRQFQLHGWANDQVVPKSAEAMIDLIGQVHKTQTQFGQDGPITVHCNTGSGRTAVFICLSLLLERMRCEGMVDVFLTTRMLRTQRTQMIQTADQYAFCYAATLEYLASFDHYTS